MTAGTGFSQSGGSGGMTPSELARLEYLEDNEYKVTYWASVSTNSGAVTKPTGSTIILDSFMSGVDAVVETIVNGQPSGLSPVTAGGAYVTVSSFDAAGNYTLSGTPSATPVALLYIVTIPGYLYQNLNNDFVITAEPFNPIVQTIINGDTTHAPSSDAVFDALAGKLAKCHTLHFEHTQLGSGASGTTYTFAVPQATAVGTGTTLTRRLPSAITGHIYTVSVHTTIQTTLAGSAQQSTLVINNKTANTTVTVGATIQYDAVGQSYVYTLGTPFAVTAGDDLECQVTMPTWSSTVPAGIIHYIDALIYGF